MQAIKINEAQSIENSNNEYAIAPTWARKQADKYSEVIIKTKGMPHKEVLKFLKKWNILCPEKSMSYTTCNICEAKINLMNKMIKRLGEMFGPQAPMLSTAKL